MSQEILRGIPGQVHLTYFLRTHFVRCLRHRRVIDLLHEYAAESRGKVSMTVLTRANGHGQSARRFGILPQQIQVVQRNSSTPADVYSGITIDSWHRARSTVFTPNGLGDGSLSH